MKLLRWRNEQVLNLLKARGEQLEAQGEQIKAQGEQIKANTEILALLRKRETSASNKIECGDVPNYNQAEQNETNHEESSDELSELSDVVEEVEHDEPAADIPELEAPHPCFW